MARVLIADDVPDNVKLLRLCLQDEGYEVVTAANGREAIELAGQHRPDAILLDVTMPVMDGIEACRRLKQDEMLAAIPVILVTALDQGDDIIRGFDAGADDYVTKPFDDRVILARTRGAVNRYQTFTENQRLLKEMERLATTDSLTGLLNRRTFFQHFERELQLANRHNTPLACVLLDIDFFKKINDDHGHPVGDATLKSVGEFLSEACRGTDFVCRFGGEEFAALLTLTNEQEAVAWAENTRQAMRRLTIPAGKTYLHVTASFGVAGRQGYTLTGAEMLEFADQSMLVAKRSGRNRVILHSGLDDDDSSLEGKLPSGGNPALEGVYARDVMSPVVCARKDTSLREAAGMLLQLHTNAIPVIDDRERVVGVISEKDIMVSSGDGALATRIVADHMSTNVVQFKESDPAQAVYDFFCRNAIRRIVVSDECRPVGVISRSDLLRWVNLQPVPCDWPAPQELIHVL